MNAGGTADRGGNERLIADLRRASRIRSERVARAFAAVPRHVFLPDLAPEVAYRDEAHVTKWHAGVPVSSSSQPAIMAVMLEQLGVEPGQRVLEIGAGTGYNAALLANLAGERGSVVAVEIDLEVAIAARARVAEAGASTVDVVWADGSFGCPAAAPYDRIMVTACASDLAPAWLEQLAPGGRLVVPLSLRGAERCVAFERRDDCLVSSSIHPCGFIPLRGALARPKSAMALGDGAGLLLDSAEELHVDPQRIHAALHEPGDVVATRTRVTVGEFLDGVSLWLALYERNVAHLVAYAWACGRELVPAIVDLPPVAGTLALVGPDGLAALTRVDDEEGDEFALGVRPFGSGGAELANVLARSLDRWEAAGRPPTRDLRIHAYASPRHASPATATATATVELPHARLAIDWPGAPRQDRLRPDARIAAFNE